MIGYECDIDTGDALPVRCGKIDYGQREGVIMKKHISALVDMEYAYGIERTRWMSKALLAPKPHQESVCDIKDSKWRFCVCYLQLNQVTRVWVFPDPRCDNASMYEFGDGCLYWFFDCLMGYHQVQVNVRSRPKLAFAGPDATLYTYCVMPFGPVNGPEMFIRMICDINREWQTLAAGRGVVFDEDTNTRIIVDDLFNHSKNKDTTFTYMSAQLEIAARRRLSFILSKSHLFMQRVKFVGLDIGTEYNMPAKSRRELLKTCPKAQDVQAVASFVAFGMFYSKWIPHFELKMQPLRDIATKYEWDDPITTEIWSNKAEEAWQYVITAIVSDPCFLRWDSRKRFYVQPNFYQLGMAFVGMQPASDRISLEAMKREMGGGPCNFLRDPPKNKHDTLMPQLKPVCFGSQKNKDYKLRLHSYLGEGFTGD